MVNYLVIEVAKAVPLKMLELCRDLQNCVCERALHEAVQDARMAVRLQRESAKAQLQDLSV